MWTQQHFPSIVVGDNIMATPKKKILSVYIDSALIDRIKTEALRQDRKISAQTEVFLRAATKNTGEVNDSKEYPVGWPEDKCSPRLAVVQ